MDIKLSLLSLILLSQMGLLGLISSIIHQNQPDQDTCRKLPWLWIINVVSFFLFSLLGIPFEGPSTEELPCRNYPKEKHARGINNVSRTGAECRIDTLCCIAV